MRSVNSSHFEEFIPRLVAALLQLIPTAHVTYCEMYPEKSQSCNYISTPELATETMDRLWEQHMHEQPVLTHFLQVHDRHATRISDFWSQRQLHDSGLHRDFYRLGNIEDSLCIAVPCPPPRVVGIAWHGEGTFNDRQRLMADLVNSHISQAWQNARLLSRMQFQLQMLQHGMEDLGEGVILCGPRGRVQFINAKARGFLEEFFSTTRQTDRSLPEQILAWLRFQNQRLNKLDDAPPVRTPLIFEKEGKRLVIRLLSQEGMIPDPDGGGTAAFRYRLDGSAGTDRTRDGSDQLDCPGKSQRRDRYDSGNADWNRKEACGTYLREAWR